MAGFSPDRIDGLFAEWDRDDSPGAALGVVQDGALVYARGYGMATLEYGVPITPRSVFYIASTSKQFTACCIALLAQQGRISLDDDIRKYFPEIPDYGHTITVRHLVHHTSGLRDYLALAMLSGRFGDAVTDEDVVEAIARQRATNFAPGEEYLYSNSGYVLMAILVQRATGKTLREYADEHLFGPLGMKSTHFHDDRTLVVPRRAWGHIRRPDGTFGLALTPYDRVGDGGLMTCIEDLALWDQSYTSHAIGGEALTRLRLTPGKLNGGGPMTYAFGLSITEYRGLPVVEHAGGFYGYCCDYIRFPEQHTSVICLFNSEGPDASGIAHRVADVVLEGRFAVPAPAASLPEAEPTAAAITSELLAGIYRSPSTGALYLIECSGAELIVIAGPMRFALERLSPTRFRAVQAPVAIEIGFVVAGSEPATAMTVVIAERPAETLERMSPVTYKADELADLAGTYASEELDTTYRVAAVDGGLVFRFHHSGDLRAISTRRDGFRIQWGDVEFRRDASGRVTGFGLSTDRARGFEFVRTDSCSAAPALKGSV